MQKHVHINIIYCMLAISVTSSLLIVFSISTKTLPLVHPALAEEKKELDFAKKDKPSFVLDANNCKSEKVLKGASNKKDLKILSECEKATGKVKHVQEMLAVWGAWVIDKPKGWNEIHPAWKVIVN